MPQKTTNKQYSMKEERPILFNTPMVQAILEGRPSDRASRAGKTQTRRVIKPQPPEDAHEFHFLDNRPEWIKRKINNSWSYFGDPEHGSFPCNDSDKLKCPYGQPGDLLWVRETFCKTTEEYLHVKTKLPFVYKADVKDFKIVKQEMSNMGWKWKPSIHMPKAAARIWLKVKDVRVERLQEISEEDILAEGVRIPVNRETGNVEVRLGVDNSALSFLPEKSINTKYTQSQLLFAHWAELWCKVNGRQSWDANPWVWVVEFEVVSTTGKPVFKSNRGNMLVEPYIPEGTTINANIQ